ncbi:XRE family transcriptional regulator [Pseudomonas petrae]|uniref:XRE family transcriptional regulator n=1 Tax=Pseudomonas petrae TaxID=2912190 RepID=UPI001F30851D|nr:helix-turn-helix transcriptional regulator [Pseudomonas petrae]MCF7557777.1 helix-turn-helix transcriptional regulator [Pseudomonas petrae]
MNESLAKRLKRLRIAAGMSQSKLAQACGWSSQSRIGNYEAGSREPTLGDIEIIAKALGLSYADVLIGTSRTKQAYQIDSNAELVGPFDVWDDDTPLDDDEVYVPFLKEVELSAGSGRTAVEQSNKKKLRFGKLTLRRQGVQPSDAVCVTVSGNSMEPVLPNGSTVGVDQGAVNIIDGKMYALNHGGQLRVKMVYRLPMGGLRLRSYNRDEHPDEEHGAEALVKGEIVIIGKVFWYSVLV